MTMTQQIRKSVFETNSSSSHSLTLAKGDLVVQPFDKAVLRKGSVTLTMGDYGWEYYRYYDTLAKAQYLFTQLFNDKRLPHGEPEEVTRELREENERFDMLCRVIEEHTGVKVLASPGSYGGVDHQSVGNGTEVFESDAKLRKLLFNPESYIQTGNDNESAGKTIETDRGTEHFYQKRYRAPKKSHVLITLRAASSWSLRNLRASNGVVISEEKHKDLYRALRKSGTVVSADFQEFGMSDYYGNRGFQGTTMAKLTSGGWHFSENLKVSRNFTRVDRDEWKDKKDKTSIQVAVPKKLAEQVAALRAPRKSKAAAKAAA